MKQMAQQEMSQKSLVDQAGQLAGTPLMDPTKNPELAEQAANVIGNLQQQQPPEE